MAKFLLYEGASDDPMRQTMRLVEGTDINEVWERNKDRALCVQEYRPDEMPHQAPLDEAKLKTPQRVWDA